MTLRFHVLFALLLAAPTLACSASTDDGTAPPPGAPAGTTDPPPSPAPPREVPADWEQALHETILEIDGRTGLGPDLKVDTKKLEADAFGVKPQATPPGGKR